MRGRDREVTESHFGEWPRLPEQQTHDYGEECRAGFGQI